MFDINVIKYLTNSFKSLNMIKNTLVKHALECAKDYTDYYCKPLGANDVGANGSHQAGIYVHKDYGKSIFPKKFNKGDNEHADIVIKWFDSGLEDHCRFIYYGKAKRTNEFRLTRISRKFKLGDYLLIIKTDNEFVGFVFDAVQYDTFITQLVKFNT